MDSMRVLVFENNLMWSPRLRKSIESLGHEVVVFERPPAELPPARAAIVNLGVPEFADQALIDRLREAGTYTIGHAGHKEKPLLDHGREVGCDRIVSNSTLTFKVEQLLAEIPAPTA
jgi:hypothetical protein